MSRKFALVIGNTDYHDTGLAQLTAPGKDAQDFARVLKDKGICAFDHVKVLLNEPEHMVRGAIEDLFVQKKPDDLLVLYFSGHGVRDELGALYLAVTNTNRSRLRSTAIKSSFISEAMDQSRSKRQVLILDCCNSGAFAQGSKAATGVSIGTAMAFQCGFGRVILTASDSTQFAWEGDVVIGETDNSLFTHFLIEGLEGDADRDGDGCITVDELYDYAYEKVSMVTPKQTPSKFSTKQQGEIVLRQNIRVEDSKPVPLPDDLIVAIKSSLPYIRQGAVHQLDELLKGKNLALARSAREALQRIAEEDDSRQVSHLASQVLQSFQQTEQAVHQQAEEERTTKAKVEAERKKKTEAERLAAQKAEEKRIAQSKAQVERDSKEEVDRLATQKAKIVALFATFTANMRTPRTITFSIAAIVVIVIAGLGIRVFSNPGTSADAELPAVHPTVFPKTKEATAIPSTQMATTISNTPTLEVLTTVSSPPMEVGSSFPYIDGGVLVAVPAGEFSMGDFGTDNPQHSVTLADYWIHSTEVTNQQYAFCVSQGKCTAPDLNDNQGYSDYRLANDPVTGVTYEQAANYCEFVNGRLPSEAEWEKAAQDSQGGSFPWGKATPSCEFLNFDHCLDGVANVVNYTNGASQYGALNMSGNVFEWVADWYDAEYYTSSPTENPPGPTSGTLRSVRSSSYTSDKDQVSIAIRNAEDPQTHRPDLGFRCVVEDPTYFALFCELPLVYEAASNQDTFLESCPDLEIKPVQFCNGSIPLTNVTFIGPSESTIDSQNCISSDNPNLFTCTSKGTVVSISAACQLKDPGVPSCLRGYLKKDNICVVDGEADQGAGNCLAGSFDLSQQCCKFPAGQTDSAPTIQACPVGTFYASRANACLPQPVREIITVTHEITLATSCTASGGGGTVPAGGSGGCQATQQQIDACNANAPYYYWNSATCSCEPAN